MKTSRSFLRMRQTHINNNSLLWKITIFVKKQLAAVSNIHNVVQHN